MLKIKKFLDIQINTITSYEWIDCQRNGYNKIMSIQSISTD